MRLISFESEKKTHIYLGSVDYEILINFDQVGWVVRGEDGARR